MMTETLLTFCPPFPPDLACEISNQDESIFLGAYESVSTFKSLLLISHLRLPTPFHNSEVKNDTFDWDFEIVEDDPRYERSYFELDDLVCVIDVC